MSGPISEKLQCVMMSVNVALLMMPVWTLRQTERGRVACEGRPQLKSTHEREALGQ